jgi:hypothetical protein
MFNDIFKAMEKNLSAEIGEKTMEIFKETQSDLPRILNDTDGLQD